MGFFDIKLGQSAFGEAASGAVSSLFGTAQQALNFRYWKKQFAAENNRQNWLINNQPSMQVNALRAAGLNPALMNEGVPQTAAVSNPSGVPQGNAPQLDILAARNQLKINEKQMLLMDAEREKTLAEADAARASADNNRANSWRIRQMTPVEIKRTIADTNLLSAKEKETLTLLPLTAQNMVADLIKTRSETKLNYLNYDKVQAETRKIVADTEKVFKEIEEIGQRIQLEKAQIDEIGALIKKYSQEIVESKSRVGVNYATAADTWSHVGVNRAQARKANADAALQEFESEIKNIVGADKYAEMVKDGFNAEQTLRYCQSYNQVMSGTGALIDSVLAW